MDHIVYLDSKAKEYEKLVTGEKSMIIRGAAGRKLPHGRVHIGDVLYFINNDGSGVIRAKADVEHVFNSEKLTKEKSEQLVAKNQFFLQLVPQQIKRWSGKRYLVLIRINNFAEIDPFSIDKSQYSNMDDWLPVGDIKSVIC